MPRSHLVFGVAAILTAVTVPAFAQSRRFDELSAAAKANDHARFAAALQQARRATSDPKLVAALRVYDDLAAVWDYSITNPIGAFFDDLSSNGLYSRLAARYPEYRAFIEPFAVRAGPQRTLFPTAETRAFLARLAQTLARETPTLAPPPAAPAPVPSLPPPPSTVAEQPGGCVPTSAIQSITPNPHGILIRSSAPIAGTLRVAPQPVEALIMALPTITVDLPNATLNAPARADWTSGPFLSMRAVLYRNDEQCGVRLRFEPRAAANWRLVRVSNGTSITMEALQPAIDEGESAVTPPPRPPGMLTVTSSISRSQDSQPGTPSNSFGFLAASFAEGLHRYGVVHGFVAEARPSIPGSPFAAIGIAGASTPAGLLDAAAGDLVIDLGGTSEGDLPSITSTLFRGAGVSLQPTAATSLQLFGGRAASASLIRVGAEEVTYAPAAHDRIIGTQASWTQAGSGLAAAAGALHTQTPAGNRTLNLFQSAEYARSPVLRIRLITEESHAYDVHADGYAYTIQTRILTRTLTLDGFYRSLSPQFRPAGGASFYASLRHSYGLAAAYQRDRLSLGASSSQSKSFSILDPQNVGSLTTAHDASVSYALSSRFSLTGSYDQSSIHTDPSAKIPADSHTQQFGGGFSFAAGKIQGSTQFVHATTMNEADPSLDLTSRRLDFAVASAYGRDIYGRLSIADSHRRNGLSAGADYRASIGGGLLDTRGWLISGEAGSDVHPAGVAQTAFREVYGTLRLSSSRANAVTGGLQFTLERVSTGLGTFNVFIASLNTQQFTRWGEGFIAPQYETRALRLVQRHAEQPRSATLRIRVFDDVNQNGVIDPGEPPVTPSFVDIGGRRYRTNARGEITAEVAAGTRRVRLLPQGAPIGYFVPAVEVTVKAVAGQTASADFALRPAGRLFGRVETEGELAADQLSGLVVRATGPVERQAVVASSAAFDFGLLPEGNYQVEFVPEVLRDHGLAAVSPMWTAHVTRGGRTSVTPRVRKLTARERFRNGG